MLAGPRLCDGRWHRTHPHAPPASERYPALLVHLQLAAVLHEAGLLERLHHHLGGGRQQAVGARDDAEGVHVAGHGDRQHGDDAVGRVVVGDVRAHHGDHLALLQHAGDEQQRGGLHDVRRRGEAVLLEHQVEPVPQHAAGGRHDPVGREHVPQRQAAHARERVAGAADGADRLVRQRLVAQVAGFRPGEHAPHHDVQAPLLQPLQQNRAGFDVQRDAQARVLLLDQGHRRRQQAQARRGDGADAHLAVVPRLQRADLVMGLVEARQRHARMPDHGLAIPGGPHAAGQALEQRHLQHVFQVLEQLGGRGLGHAEHLGRAVDVALLGQGHQQQQLPGLEARADEPVVVGAHGVFLNAGIDMYFVQKTIGLI